MVTVMTSTMVLLRFSMFIQDLQRNKPLKLGTGRSCVLLSECGCAARFTLFSCFDGAFGFFKVSSSAYWTLHTKYTG